MKVLTWPHLLIQDTFPCAHVGHLHINNTTNIQVLQQHARYTEGTREMKIESLLSQLLESS